MFLFDSFFFQEINANLLKKKLLIDYFKVVYNPKIIFSRVQCLFEMNVVRSFANKYSRNSWCLSDCLKLNVHLYIYVSGSPHYINTNLSRDIIECKPNNICTTNISLNWKILFSAKLYIYVYERKMCSLFLCHIKTANLSINKQMTMSPHICFG